GPHRTEQASAHPHDVVLDPRGRFLVVPDKGLDTTFVFRLDTATGKLVPAEPPSLASRAGAGPRHDDFHPSQPSLYPLHELDPTGSLLYAANQNSDTIVTFRVDQATGKLKPTGHVVKTGSPSSIAFR